MYHLWKEKKIVSWRHAYDANELFIGVWGPKKKMSYEHVSGLNCGNITTFIMAYIIGICIVWLNLHIPIVWLWVHIGHTSIYHPFQENIIEYDDINKVFTNIIKHLFGRALPWGMEGQKCEIVDMFCCPTCKLKCDHPRIYHFECCLIDWLDFSYLEMLEKQK